MKLVQKLLASAVLASISMGSAMAATATGNFQATSTLSSTCAVTATDINFGQFTGAQKDVTGTFTALCSKGVPYTVTIGTGQSANVLDRRLKGAIVGNTDQLAYQIYNDATYQNIWAAQTGQAGSQALLFSGTGAPDTKNIYGRLKSGNQFVLADSYADTLSITLSY